MEAVFTKCPRDGWIAVSTFPLLATKLLIITTKRGFNDRLLSSQASVCTVKPDGAHVTMYGGPHADFCCTVVPPKSVRVTQAVIRAEHQLALSHLTRVMQAATEHYAPGVPLQSMSDDELTHQLAQMFSGHIDKVTYVSNR